MSRKNRQPHRPTSAEIKAAFEEAEATYDGKSDAWLASIVADQLGIEYGDVFDAISE